MHRLFHTFAHRYDLHTPPSHYQHDHQLVLDLAAEQGPGCRVLDVGCGTGVLVQKALHAGFDAYGLDSSEEMIEVARTRVPSERGLLSRMQELDEVAAYDLIVSMSWSIHYCSGEGELADVLRRMHRALRPGGRLLLQAAHGPNLGEDWVEDIEPGPGGDADDVSLCFRFRRLDIAPARVLADYAYTCRSTGEKLNETHVLECADAFTIAALAGRTFDQVHLWDSWRRESFSSSGSPFVCATKSGGGMQLRGGPPKVVG